MELRFEGIAYEAESGAAIAGALVVLVFAYLPVMRLKYHRPRHLDSAGDLRIS